MFDRFAPCVKFGRMKTRKPSSTKLEGRCPQDPSPSLVGTTLLRTAEQKVPLVKSCYMFGVVFSSLFLLQPFLVNGDLTFTLVEQDSICFVVLQISFVPNPCLPPLNRKPQAKKKNNYIRTKQSFSFSFFF